MRIFDVPNGYWGAGRAMRVAVHGSCRVHDPFEALATAGSVTRVWASYLSTSYTLGEAHQMLQFSLGNSNIPAALQPYIFDAPDQVPPWTPAQRRVLEDVDVFIVEVSDLRQVRYRNSYFQLQVFIRNFVSKYGSAVLQWYRPFSISAPISDELVHKALSEMPGVTDEERSLFETILREARLESVDVEATKLAIERIRFNPSARWLFVSHFVVPDLAGTLMKDRVKLRDTLREATAACGVEFFDPSEVVAKHGREVSLAKGGTDIYHYDKAFQSIIAERLLGQICSSLPRASAAVRPSDRPHSSNGNVAVQAVASALNALLVSLHRERLSQSDIEASGLYAHYAFLLERNQLLGRQEIDLVSLMLHYMPEFDCYHVLRAGLGEIAFLLVAFARKITAVDPFDSRLSAIEAGAAHLEKCGFLEEGSLRVLKGVVPSGARQGRVLAVATQLTITATPSEEEDILQSLESYDAILFHPTLLVRPRDAEEQEMLLERFRRAGFTMIREYPQLKVVYCAKEEMASESRASAHPLRATQSA